MRRGPSDDAASGFNIQKRGLEGGVRTTKKVITGQGGQVVHTPRCIEDGQ